MSHTASEATEAEAGGMYWHEGQQLAEMPQNEDEARRDYRAI